MTGFESGGKFCISECASSSGANSAGCGPGLPVQPFGITHSDGSGSYTSAVGKTAAAKPNQTAKHLRSAPTSA